MENYQEMTINIIVLIGEVIFLLFADRDNRNSINNIFSIIISHSNYFRLMFSHEIWHALKGCNYDLNLIFDVADMEFQPDEIIKIDFDKIPFDWSNL